MGGRIEKSQEGSAARYLRFQGINIGFFPAKSAIHPSKLTRNTNDYLIGCVFRRIDDENRLML